MGIGRDAFMKKVQLIVMEKNRLEALQNAIDNQNKEIDDAALAEREKECLKDTGNLKVLTYYRWFCETVGLVPKTKEHRD